MNHITPILLLLTALPAFASAAPARFSIADHGALADGTTVNTKAIQATIDACAAQGGGVVVVPKGVFVSGAIFFKPHVNFQLEKDAVLRGTTNFDDYPQVPTRWEGIERVWTSALVNFFDCTNVVMSGEGLIDGSGEGWPSLFGNRARGGGPPTNAAPTRGRPRLIAFQNCADVRVSGLHFQDQACWCLFMVYCENVTAENLVIRAQHNIPSSDGIDIDSCKHIRVTGCDIDVNDDCISIKSGKNEDGRRVNRPCEDVVIEKTRFAYGHGGVAMGSEISGGVRHVEVRDCVAEAGNWAVARFKSQPSRGGVVEDIIFRDMKMHDVKQAVEFNMEWRMGPALPPAPELTQVRHVRFINFNGTATNIGVIHGLKDGPVTDVKFENCHLTAQHGLILENTSNIDTSGLTLEVAEGDPIVNRSSPK